MSLSAAASGFVVFLLSVSGTVYLQLHSLHQSRRIWENVGLNELKLSCGNKWIRVSVLFVLKPMLFVEAPTCVGRLVSLCPYFYHREEFWRDFCLTVKSPQTDSTVITHLHQMLLVPLLSDLSVIFPCYM